MEWELKEIAWDWEKKEAGSGETSKWVEEPAESTPKDHTGDSEPGSSKRRRAQDTWCSVDGCDSDMSGCREYHRRHRVCEKHSKTPVVWVGGKQQRFCQQCSRFHSLGEFDEVKRSCRKRLDGHNRRRRKPQPPSLFLSADKFLSTYKGPRILHFGSPQTYANPFMRSMWPATVKAGAEPTSVSYDQHSVLSSLANVQHQQDKQIPLLQANGNEAFSGISMTQPISGAISPSASGRGSQKVASDCKAGSFDPGCALYLLSTLQTQSPELSLVQSALTSPMQSSLGDVHLDAGDKYSCSESPQKTDLQYNGMLHMWSDGMVENRDSPSIPFFWE